MAEFSVKSSIPRLCLCGPPASGKTEQSSAIAEDLGIVHLDVGERKRTIVTRNMRDTLEFLCPFFLSNAAVLIKADADKYPSGVPDVIVVDLVKKRLQEADCMKGWLLDGFPSTEKQAESLRLAGIDFDYLIRLDAEESTCRARIAKRRFDPFTGKQYHDESYAESTDALERLVPLPDNTEEMINSLLASYKASVPGLLCKMGEKVVSIDANRPSLVICADIRLQINRFYHAEVIFVLGGPGAGKGTLCSRLVYEFGYVHLSAGDLLREERSKAGELSETINRIMVEGGIVPAHITVRLLANAMRESTTKKFLVDGFPRNYDNMVAWFELMSGQCIVDFVLNLELDEDTMKSRLLERGKTSGRSDDNEATIVKRFRTFNEDTMPVMETFSFCGKLRTVSTAPPPEIVFADAARLFRAQRFFPPYQRTFAFIKPDAVRAGRVPAILAAIAEANLAVVAKKFIEITPDIVVEFYKEHELKPFFPNLQRFMTSGPAVALVLEGSFAVRTWRQLMGPTNSTVARSTAPNSLRARFGTDNTMNACHGSDSEFSALREIRFWMDPKGPGAACEVGRANFDAALPDEGVRKGRGVLGLAKEDTFAMIKPVTATIHAENILSLIIAHGFEIVAQLHTTLSLTQSQSFYAEHRGKEFYEALTTYMSSGPIIALHLRRAGAIAGWRHLIGPTNLDKATRERPESIRAKFGIDKTRNAVHGSDSLESAQREIAFFFSYGCHSTITPPAQGAQWALTGPVAPLSPSKSALPLSPVKVSPTKSKTAYSRRVHALPSISRTDISAMQKYASYEVDPVMQSLLEKLMLTRPSDVTGFAIGELSELRTKGSKP